MQPPTSAENSKNYPVLDKAINFAVENRESIALFGCGVFSAWGAMCLQACLTKRPTEVMLNLQRQRAHFLFNNKYVSKSLHTSIRTKDVAWIKSKLTTKRSKLMETLQYWLAREE
jgi:hypothetical protein